MILINTSAVKIIVKAMFSCDSIKSMVSSNAGYLSIARQTVFKTITSMIEPSNSGWEIRVKS